MPEFRYARGRIIDSIRFLSEEMKEFQEEYSQKTKNEYQNDRKLQKLMDRTVENILTALVEVCGTLKNISSLLLLEPVGYHDSLWLTGNARFALTDSGGLQEESTYLRTPCLTLRPNTERPITIEVGTNKLTTVDQLRGDIEEIIQNRRPAGQIPPLWDGHTAERILRALNEKS